MLGTFLNSDFYANHPSLQYVFNFNRGFYSSFSSVLFLSLSHKTTDSCLQNNNGPFLFKRETFVMCNDGIWASFIYALTLASVINRKICLYYPDFGPE